VNRRALWGCPSRRLSDPTLLWVRPSKKDGTPMCITGWTGFGPGCHRKPTPAPHKDGRDCANPLILQPIIPSTWRTAWSS
jgi:hypothetical protein